MVIAKPIPNFTVCTLPYTKAAWNAKEGEWQQQYSIDSYPDSDSAAVQTGEVITMRLGDFNDGEDFCLEASIPVTAISTSKVGTWLVFTNTLGDYALCSTKQEARNAINWMIEKITRVWGDNVPESRTIIVDALRLDKKIPDPDTPYVLLRTYRIMVDTLVQATDIDAALYEAWTRS